MPNAENTNFDSLRLPVPAGYPRSLLSYPGGKSRAINLIYPCIPKNEKKLCSPFLGGGAIELACTVSMEVYGYDIFSPLADFWQVLLDSPSMLADSVQRYYPVSKAKFYDLQKRFTTINCKLERAAAFFVLNRSSYSCLTLSGGFSTGHQRLTMSAIERLRNFRAPGIHVGCLDFRESIPRHTDAFLYLDPPYINDHNLYGTRGNAHKGFDHSALAEILKRRDRWILSYNDSKTVRNLYTEHTIITVGWAYSMSGSREATELLILSRDLDAEAISGWVRPPHLFPVHDL